MDDANRARAGFLAAFTAFALWGLLPLYWGLLSAVPPWEVLAHRVIWTAVLCAAILVASATTSTRYSTRCWGCSS